MTEDGHMEDLVTIRVDLSRSGRSENVSISMDSTVIDLVRKLNEPIDGVIVLQDGRPIPLDQTIDMVRNSVLKVISVASGG